MKDEVFCLFEGALDNLGSLIQQYGLGKSANEVLLVIEAYKALRDRAPYPANRVVGHLSGSFAFIVFDKSTSTLFVASVRNFTLLYLLPYPPINFLHQPPPALINYPKQLIDVLIIIILNRISLVRFLCIGE